MQRIGLDDNGNIMNTVVGENTENLFSIVHATRRLAILFQIHLLHMI